MSTATATRTDSTLVRNEDAIVVSQELLDNGANVVRSLRLNGIKQRDKEIVVINMLDPTYNDQNPAWQKVIAAVSELAGKDKKSFKRNSESIVGQIADHLFEQLGPVRAG